MLTFASPPSNLSAETESGDITVYLPTSVEYMVDALSGRGEVTIDVAESTASLFRIFARTDLGDVHIFNAREGSACERPGERSGGRAGGARRRSVGGRS